LTQLTRWRHKSRKLWMAFCMWCNYMVINVWSPYTFGTLVCAMTTSSNNSVYYSVWDVRLEASRANDRAEIWSALSWRQLFRYCLWLQSVSATMVILCSDPFDGDGKKKNLYICFLIQRHHLRRFSSNIWSIFWVLKYL
jgi:hypothetical protein